MNAPELKDLRRRRGWTQKKTAEMLNATLGRSYDAGAIGRWENGKKNIPPDVGAFFDRIAVAEAEEVIEGVFDGDREIPFEHEPGDIPPPPPGPSAEDAARNVAALVGGGSYARICEELWELVATGVGMVGAVTGSDKLQQDGKIILNDKAALGKAYGKLAEQNATFRNMLIGMSGGGAWLEVALVSGITAGKLMRNHQRPPDIGPHAVVEPEPQEPGPERMYGDGAVIDLPV